MHFATFFQKSAWPVGSSELVEACGDRATIVLDGRESQSAHERIAREECQKRGYVAWQLHKGDSFTRANPITRIHKV